MPSLFDLIETEAPARRPPRRASPVPLPTATPQAEHGNMFDKVEPGMRQLPSWWEDTKRSWNKGAETSDLDMVWSAVVTGEYDEDVAWEQTREFRQRYKENPLLARNWFREGVMQTVEMVPHMVEGYKQGAGMGLTLAMGFGGAAAIFGQNPALIAVPDEAVTVPGATAIGWQVGMTAGSLRYWYRQGLGSLYRDMREAGIPSHIARPIAQTAAAPYAAIEFAQVAAIIPGMKAAKQAAKKTLAKRLIQLGLRYVEAWEHELCEEALQRLNNDVAMDVAKAIAGIKQAPLKDRVIEYVWNMGEEIGGAAFSMGLLLAPGMAGGVIAGIAEGTEQRAQAAIGEEAPPLDIAAVEEKLRREVEMPPPEEVDLGEGQIEPVEEAAAPIAPVPAAPEAATRQAELARAKPTRKEVPEGKTKADREALVQAAKTGETVRKIDAALAEGKTDKETARIAKYLVSEVDPSFDADSALTISDAARVLTEKQMEARGLEAAADEEFVAFGATQRQVEDGALRTVISLYQGHTPSTLIHEWLHRAYKRLNPEQRAAWEAYHEAHPEAHNADEHWAQAGEAHIMGTRMLADPDAGIAGKVFDRIRQMLGKMVEAVKRMKGAMVPQQFLDMFERAVTPEKGGQVDTEGKGRVQGREPQGQEPGRAVQQPTGGKAKVARGGIFQEAEAVAKPAPIGLGKRTRAAKKGVTKQRTLAGIRDTSTVPGPAKMGSPSAQQEYEKLREIALSPKTTDATFEQALKNLQEMRETGDLPGQGKLFETPRPEGKKRTVGLAKKPKPEVEGQAEMFEKKERGLFEGAEKKRLAAKPGGAETDIVARVDSAINGRARDKIYGEIGKNAVPGLRLQEHVEAGRLKYLVEKGEATQKEFDEQVAQWRKEGRISETVEPPAKPAAEAAAKAKPVEAAPPAKATLTRRAERNAMRKVNMAVFNEYRKLRNFSEDTANVDAKRIWDAIRDEYSSRSDKGLWLERLIKSGDLFNYLEEQVVEQPDDGIPFQVGKRKKRLAAVGPTWYSALSRAVGRLTAEKWSGPQLLARLTKTPGVKGDELFWTGLDEFLANNPKVTKEEVAEFLRANEVKVEEKLLGGNDPRLDNPMVWAIGPDAPRAPKFEQWQVPGGENYRELLLKLPEQRGRVLTQKQMEARRLEAAVDPSFDADSALEISDTADAFTGGHYNEPNVLAHVRFNERLDADGNRVLFIEEIQSDWHQKGRAEGYQRVDAGRDARKAELQRLYQEGWHYRTDTTVPAEVAAFDRIQQLERADVEAERGVPDAPFKKTWPDLAMKRIVRWAAEEGFDRVAWTTGEQQAERYDLSKQVDEIRWSSDKGKNRTYITIMGLKGISNQDIEISVDRDTGIVGTMDIGAPEQWQGKHISDIVGKDISEKILASWGGSLREDGLKIGGEGMRAFYDVQLPRVANKIGQKFGARVGSTTIKTGGKEESTVSSLTLTDALRESALQGMPLFQVGKRKKRLSATERKKVRLEGKKAEAIPPHIVKGWFTDKLNTTEKIVEAIKNALPRTLAGRVNNASPFEQMRDADTIRAAQKKRKAAEEKAEGMAGWAETAERTPDEQALMDVFQKSKIAYGPGIDMGEEIATALEGTSVGAAVRRPFKKMGPGEVPDGIRTRALDDFIETMAEAAPGIITKETSTDDALDIIVNLARGTKADLPIRERMERALDTELEEIGRVPDLTEAQYKEAEAESEWSKVTREWDEANDQVLVAGEKLRNALLAEMPSPQRDARETQEAAATRAEREAQTAASLEDIARSGTTSIKNAVVDAELALMGYGPATHGESLQFEEALNDAAIKSAVDPHAGRKLVQSLVDNPRPATGLEVGLLTREGVRLKLERRDADNAFNEATEAGDKTAILEAESRKNQARKDYEAFADVVTKTGTTNAQGLAFRKMLVKEDYTLASMERAMTVANKGRPLTEEQLAEVKELHDQIARTEDALRKAMAENKRLRAKPMPRPTIQAYGSRNRIVTTEQADKVRARLRSMFARMNMGLDPTALADLTVVGMYHIEAGAREIGAWKAKMIEDFGPKVKEFLDNIWKSSSQQVTASKRENIVETAAIKVSQGESAGVEARALAQTFLAEGITEREALLDAVHAEMQKIEPDITRRQVADAISGYGQYRQLSQEELAIRLREISGELQQLSKLEDMEAGRAPSKTGVERRTPTDEERRLIKQVEAAKKRGGFHITDPATQLKSALGEVKTRLRHQIADLEAQIASRKRIVKEGKAVELDEEARELRTRRDELRVQFDAIFDTKKTLTDKQRLAMATRAVEKSIEEYTRRIAENDLFPTQRKAKPISNAAFEALQARRDALRQELKTLQEIARPKKTPEERARQAYITRLTNRIAELKDKLVRGDFIVPERKPRVLSERELHLKYEHEKAKQEYLAAKLRYEIANYSMPRKIWRGLAALNQLPRSLLASFDVSATFRQGGAITMGDPVAAGKMLAVQFKALASEERQFTIEEEIRNRENYPRYLRAGLDLTDPTSEDLTRREEEYMSRLADKIPGIAASGRAFTTGLNILRADTFDAMHESWMTLEDEKIIANYINVATGRGWVGSQWMKQVISATNNILWAGRLNVSRVELLIGMPLWYRAGKASSWRVRTAIAKRYARHLAGMGAILGLAGLYNLTVDDDDEKIRMEPNPLSTDFGKLRVGTTRYDITSGVGSWATFAAREIVGKTKTGRGQIVSIRGDVPSWREDAFDVFTRQMRYKLTPTVGQFFNILTGENPVGEDTTFWSVMEGLTVPLVAQDVYDAAAEQGIPSVMINSPLAIVGVGMNTYGKKKRLARTVIYPHSTGRTRAPRQKRSYTREK